MNTLTKSSLVAAVLVGICVPARAQIAITSGDVAAQLAPGNFIHNIQDTLTTQVDIGAAGATSWDFSGLLTHVYTNLTSVDPASTPYFAYFSSATHALKTSLSGSIPGAPGPVSGDLYLYLALGTSLMNPGQMGGGTVNIGGSNYPGEIRFRNAPFDTTYGLPSSLGTQWGSTYTSNDTIWIHNIPFIGTLEVPGTPDDHSYNFIVDAYGSMTIPGGSAHEALRIKKSDRGSGSIVGWIFLAKDGASVQLAPAEQTDNGTIAVARSSITWSPAFTTGLVEPPSAPRTFALAQNYPNPFNPTTTITYNLPEAADVILEVFDPLGRTIATLERGRMEPGEHHVAFNGSGLASGIYFYQLRADAFVQTRAMLLVK